MKVSREYLELERHLRIQFYAEFLDSFAESNSRLDILFWRGFWRSVICARQDVDVLEFWLVIGIEAAVAVPDALARGVDRGAAQAGTPEGHKDAEAELGHGRRIHHSRKEIGYFFGQN